MFCLIHSSATVKATVAVRVIAYIHARHVTTRLGSAWETTSSTCAHMSTSFLRTVFFCGGDGFNLNNLLTRKELRCADLDKTKVWQKILHQDLIPSTKLLWRKKTAHILRLFWTCFKLVQLCKLSTSFFLLQIYINLEHFDTMQYFMRNQINSQLHD